MFTIYTLLVTLFVCLIYKLHSIVLTCSLGNSWTLKYRNFSQRDWENMSRRTRRILYDKQQQFKLFLFVYLKAILVCTFYAMFNQYSI